MLLLEPQRQETGAPKMCRTHAHTHSCARTHAEWNFISLNFFHPLEGGSERRVSWGLSEIQLSISAETPLPAAVVCVCVCGLSVLSVEVSYQYVISEAICIAQQSSNCCTK